MLGGGGTGTIQRKYIGRLNPDGSLDAAFNPGANGGVRAITVQQDGKILVGGYFTMLGGGGTGATSRSRIGRLDADGSLDATAGVFYWQPAPGFLGSFDLEFVRRDTLVVSPESAGVVAAPPALARADVGDGDRSGRFSARQPTTGLVEKPSPAPAPAGASAVRVRVVVGPAMRAVIDTPSADSVVEQPFTLAGWALDLAATNGTGVDTVHVWAYPATGADPIFLGVAAYGDKRADVGRMFGEALADAAYGLTADSLPPDTYDIVVYPHRAKTNTFDGAQIVRMTVR